MTEQDWLVCDDRQKLQAIPISKAGDRKKRLFVCACCRRIWHLLPDPRTRTAIEAVEFGEGEDLWSDRIGKDAEEAVWSSTTLAERLAARTVCELLQASKHLPCWTLFDSTPLVKRHVEYPLRCAEELIRALALTTTSDNKKSAMEAQRLIQAGFFLDIFGNSFCLAAPAPTWLVWHDGTIPKLAQALYDERAFNRLPILADALEEAGCANTDILSHCRGPGPHVRGCWVVDLLLGKE